LEKRFVLGMPCGTVKHDREHAVGKPFNHIADLQVVLAIAVG